MLGRHEGLKGGGTKREGSTTLPLFTKSVATLGTTTERSDTPPILMVVLRVTGMHLHGGIDRQTRCWEVTHRTDVTGTR